MRPPAIPKAVIDEFEAELDDYIEEYKTKLEAHINALPVEKANPYHGANSKFTSGGAASAGGDKPWLLADLNYTPGVDGPPSAGVPRTLQQIDMPTWYMPDQGFSNAEVSAIGAYTNGQYKAINSSLRLGVQPPEYTKEVVSGLDSAMTKSRLPQNLTLYRGTGQQLNLKVGDQFVDHGYVSTSIREMTARAFTSGTVVKIRASAGTRALKGNSAEGEIILPRGTTFKVSGIDGQFPVLEIVG